MSTDYIVAKPFAGPEGMLDPGTRVDASGWRNVDTLVRGRFLRACEDTGPPARFAIVCKPFLHEGALLESGTLVDLDGWRNVEPLIASRFLREATDADLDRATRPPLVLDPGSGGLELAGAKGKRRT